MKESMIEWLDRHAAPEWRGAHKLWEVRIAVFWAAVSGLYAAWPAFAGFLPPFEFALVSIGLAVALVVARLAHQPGADI